MKTREAEKKTVEYHSFKDHELDPDNLLFRQVIGSLLYSANVTRPDIAFAVNCLSRKQNNYDLKDWFKVKRIIGYLKGTMNLGLLYESKTKIVDCFVDASLEINDCEGKSNSGYVIKIFEDEINWRTKKQSHTSLSSAEAKFIAMSFACRDVINLNEICKYLLHLNMIPTLYEDNKGAIKLAKTKDSQSLKYIMKLCYHYITLKVKTRNLNVKWIGANDQTGDFFTKAPLNPNLNISVTCC